MSQFEGRVIAITGAASGMGLATAKKLLSLGARISVSDINKEALQSAIFASNPNRPEISGSNILITAIDVRSSVQVDAWIEATIEHFGKLDGAANCAGILGAGADKYRIQELPDDIWKSVIDVNLSGVFYCLKAELKAMHRGGSVVNIASIAGVKGNALNGSYSASKHGVVGLTKTAAQEVGGDGIRVNCVVP
jgi:NAD(P)-dependent dehydrogenase (short-subunit alcohol dehydrogenase family)